MSTMEPSDRPIYLDLARVSLIRRRTKIVATVGPASATDEMIENLIRAGVDVFRLNFSHGTHEVHGQHIERIRRISHKVGHHVAILADLCGPKIRVGMFRSDCKDGGIDLEPGQRVTVTTRDVEGAPGLIPSQYRALASDVKALDRILLDDGKLELSVEETDGKSEVRCVVVAGGRLTHKKGINLPGVAVSAPALTDKDRADATFAIAQGVDFLALSFVRLPSDVLGLRELVRAAGATTPIISKIEKPEAIGYLNEILDVSDGVMVARGDLGVEMPAEEVPLLQSEIIRAAIRKNRPVIVATQMLESMIEHARPTRAEVTDVAWAAMARADAVMLSAETAAGKHPLEAVRTMDRVLRMVEGYQWHRGEHGRVEPARHGEHRADAEEALSRATSLLSADLGTRAIVVPTRTGRTARLVSAERPAAPVIALTGEVETVRRLALSWGVLAEKVEPAALADPRAAAIDLVRRLGLADSGQPVLLVWDASHGGGRVEPTVSILRV